MVYHLTKRGFLLLIAACYQDQHRLNLQLAGLKYQALLELNELERRFTNRSHEDGLHDEFVDKSGEKIDARIAKLKDPENWASHHLERIEWELADWRFGRDMLRGMHKSDLRLAQMQLEKGHTDSLDQFLRDSKGDSPIRKLPKGLAYELPLLDLRSESGWSQAGEIQTNLLQASRDFYSRLGKSSDQDGDSPA